jgi:hypothetical protein
MPVSVFYVDAIPQAIGIICAVVTGEADESLLFRKVLPVGSGTTAFAQMLSG